MLKERLFIDLRTAMKSGNPQTTTIIRCLIAEIHNEEIKHGLGFVADETIEMNILTRECSRYEEALSFAHQSGREHLIVKCQSELDFIRGYLPQQLSEEEVQTMIVELLEPIENPTSKHLGIVMKGLTQQIKGKFNMKRATELVKEGVSACLP